METDYSGTHYAHDLSTKYLVEFLTDDDYPPSYFRQFFRKNDWCRIDNARRAYDTAMIAYLNAKEQRKHTIPILMLKSAVDTAVNTLTAVFHEFPENSLEVLILVLDGLFAMLYNPTPRGKSDEERLLYRKAEYLQHLLEIEPLRHLLLDKNVADLVFRVILKIHLHITDFELHSVFEEKFLGCLKYNLEKIPKTYKTLAKERIEPIKEGIMMEAWKPSRVAALLEAGVDLDDM